MARTSDWAHHELIGGGSSAGGGAGERWWQDRGGTTVTARNPARAKAELGHCHTCFSIENQVQTYMHARIKFHAYSDI
jgi:hypothetical protein